MTQVCIVCLYEKPDEDFDVDHKRRTGRKRRCKSCAVDVEPPEPPSTPPPPPPAPRCECGEPLEAPGLCGFCVEERTGESLTEEGIVPVFRAAGPEHHRALVAQFVAIELRGSGTHKLYEPGRARCPEGHLLEGENLGANGKCRRCDRAKQRETRAAKGAVPSASRRPLVAA